MMKAFTLSNLYWVGLLALVACSDAENSPSNTATPPQASTPPSASTASSPAANTLAIPHIPAIVIPDFIGVTEQQLQFEQAMPADFNNLAGIKVYPARCDNQQLINSNGSISQYSADNATQVNHQGVLSVNKDGSGTSTDANMTIEVQADGSGTLVKKSADDDTGITINVNADGSGTYVGPEGTMTIDGKGGGTWVGKLGSITINADGSGTWTGENDVVEIQANGAGNWTGSQMQTNLGDGTGTVGPDEKPVKMAPWPLAPKVGKLPLLNKLHMPGQVCGYVISLDDQVLFDFDQAQIRPDAANILQQLATALKHINAAGIEIRGHTDSKGSDEYNQTLSENRAQAVLKALQQQTPLNNIQAHGFGETLPVAPNEVDGKDSPSNRQLNRRVEIFVRTS